MHLTFEVYYDNTGRTKNGKYGIIREIDGGHGIKKRLEVMNIREGKKIIKMLSTPYVVLWLSR